MGYWQFIFQHQQWYELYEKNCSLKTQEQWYAEGKPNIPLGLIYFISGLFFELTYIPFLIVMLKHEFFQYSCYKLMFLMGVIDIFVLPCNGIITGIQVMKGQHFCHNPNLYYAMGAIGCWGFYGFTTLCVIMAINRFLEMCFPKIAAFFFGGKRVYVWMAIPILYQFFTGFQIPQIFNIKIYAMNHDPYHLIPDMANNSEFNFNGFQTFFLLNYSIVIAILIFIYGALLVVTKIQTSIYNMPSPSKAQKMKTFQTLLFCGGMFVAPLLNIFMLFYQHPVTIEIIAHIGWIYLYGNPPFIYFILNPPLRKAALKMLSTIFGISESCTNIPKRVYSLYQTSEINQTSTVAPAMGLHVILRNPNTLHL